MYGKQKDIFLTSFATRFGRGVGRFVLFVMMLNFLSTAALSATGLNAQDTLNDDPFSGGQSYVICTPQGLKRITLDENGTPINDDKGNLDHCVYCLPFHKGVMETASPEAGLPVVPLLSYTSAFPQDDLIIPADPLNDACPPRAPPAL